jgi:hypothetical protein
MDKVKTKRKISDKLNPREARAVAFLKSGKAKTKTEALKKAGYSNSVAEGRQKDVLGKPRMQSALMSAFEQVGINDTFLAERHKTLIVSNEHQAVSKGLDMAYKLRGEYAPEKQEHSGSIGVGIETDEDFMSWLVSTAAAAKKEEKP